MVDPLRDCARVDRDPAAECAAPRLAQERPPNIIHIVADDVGYDDIGPFGSTDIPTPHLDRLAKEGRRLTSFVRAALHLHTDTAALLTGAYAPCVGLPSVLFPDSRIGINAEEVTIAELLKGGDTQRRSSASGIWVICRRSCRRATDSTGSSAFRIRTTTCPSD